MKRYLESPKYFLSRYLRIKRQASDLKYINKNEKIKNL